MTRVVRFLAGLGAVAVLAAPAAAQQGETVDARVANGARVTKMELTETRVDVPWGRGTVLPKPRLLDADGRPVDAQVRYFSRDNAVSISGDTIRASEGGEFRVFAMVVTPPDYDGARVYQTMTAVAAWPPIRRVAIETEPGTLYAGTALRHTAHALHEDGSERPHARFRWSSSDPSVASVDDYGNVVAHRPGRVTISAASEGATGTLERRVAAFPAASLAIEGGAQDARTGDVVAFSAVAKDRAGRVVGDVPVTWAFTYLPDDSIEAPGAAGEVRDGRFVGEEPGAYTILATAGPLTARRTIKLASRDVVRLVELVGRGAVTNVHTSDSWPFTGLDGRDYVITGTWGADGWAYFWDITDPSNIVKVDSIHVDARTVNDVKVSPDGRYAALGREGASNRKNGVVIVDLKDPRHPVIASNYDEGLTGGVHNLFALDDYLFALSGGDKYVILDVRDIAHPKYVSEYNHPNSYIHDVWVSDGLAYSSEWGTGVVVVDVGNGRWGGSIEHPKLVTTFAVPTGATHAAFPYFQRSTGKTYLFLGDEIMRRDGMAWAGSGVTIPNPGTAPAATYGYVHIVDFTDPAHPKYVARYEADEFGTHNMWVEDDVLYQAYYEGGMRMVDVSGELMGDLKAQGREIAVFKPFDPQGYVANAPMVWGGFTHKGRLFLSDFNSGLWSVRLKPQEKPTT